MVKQSIVALALMFVAFGASAQGSTLLLDFASSQCPPCRQMMPTVRSLEEAGYPVRKIDVTQDKELASRFGVTQIPCFVMLADGREVGRIVGATSRDRLEQLFHEAQRQSESRPPAEADSRVRHQSPDPQPPADPWSGVPQPSSPVAVRQSSTPPTSAAELISSSVRLRVEDSTGQSYGTGTIIDARSGEALIITCGHLFRESEGEGRVTVELFTADDRGPQAVGELPGTVVGYNLDRDIGFVSIKPSSSVRVAPVARADTLIDRGDRVTSVGCNHGQDPSALTNRVTAINRYQGPPNIEVGGAPVIGRSGGGLFNADGHLIGVCYAADYESDEGLYAAVESIHDELDRLGLSDIYRSQGGGEQPVDGGELAARTASNPSAANWPNSLEPAMARAGSQAVRPVNLQSPDNRPAAAASAQLSAAEQAALEEIVSRAATAEVVCIIRPKEPGGKSEVITLDGVSPEFVRALAEVRQSVSSTVASRPGTMPAGVPR